MRIAIVGGGASGLITAYLLGNRHEVHLFERAPHLGGHVRTLGLNVPVEHMPPGEVAENGPLAFHAATSPTLMCLLRELQLPTRSAALGSNLFLADDRHFFLRPELRHWRRRFIESTTGGLETGISLLRFLVRTRRAWAQPYHGKQLGEVLPHLPYLRDWLRCMVMMCYSLPLDRVDSLPLPFAAPTLRSGFLEPEWKYLPRGVYSYLAKILSLFDGKVFLDSSVDKIYRNDEGVTLSVNGQTTTPYDRLVVATAPGRVLSMLDRPTAIESRCFSGWDSDIPFHTIAHTDSSLYANKRPVCLTVADYFQRDDGSFGYNCCCSSIYSSTNSFTASFAYNLDDLIEPSSQLDSHEHRIPAYSDAALRHREELIQTNGANHTYYAGAYLGCGLHEGAACSANRVARLMGERALDVAEDAS